MTSMHLPPGVATASDFVTFDASFEHANAHLAVKKTVEASRLGAASPMGVQANMAIYI